MRYFIFLTGIIVVTVMAYSLNSIKPQLALEGENANNQFSNYWYKGKAEITSFELTQARYGELRKGSAVLVFVTEPFSKEKQVKSDKPQETDISVMKLNFTKKFTTGIYPYSMMSSTFVPVKGETTHAVKNTFSSQEWCGHTFTQLNNRDGIYTIQQNSYFESEGDRSIKMDEDWLEDELWIKIRTNPKQLPLGEIMVVPSFSYCRLMHKEIGGYRVICSLESDEVATHYKLEYPELKRTMTITFENNFPYYIKEWKETYVSGWGEGAKVLTTTGKRKATITSDYWNKHGNRHNELRKELELE